MQGQTNKLCSFCNEPGHNARTCPQGSTKYAQVFPLLASHTNREIAEKLGMPRSSVAYLRMKAGIPSPAPLPTKHRRQGRPRPRPPTDLEGKYPGLTAKLGVEPDADLSRAYGLSRQRIYQMRVQRGIKLPDIPITPEIIALLGVIPDTEIHRRYPEISLFRLRHARQARRLPAAPIPYEEAIKERLYKVKDRLGVVSDQQIAKELKVAPQTVARFRNKLKIAPTRRGRRPGVCVR